jgi:hypothetical protein
MATLLCVFLFNNTGMFAPENILRFADHLYASQDYDAALQEYRRYTCLVDSLPGSTRERMIDCYVQAARFAEAHCTAERFPDRNYAAYAKGYILYKQALFDSCRICLKSIGIPYREKSLVIIGLSYAQQMKFQDASRFIALPGAIPQHKSVAAGALLSLFPGGGHLYCGRVGDGLFSCAVVSLSALLATYYHSKDEDLKFSISFGATLLFYAGNIYGGINAVRNYNYYVDDAYRRAIIGSIGPIDPFYR